MGIDITNPLLDLGNLEFEWDDEKDRYNFEHHGIHFKTAVKVFAEKHLVCCCNNT